MSILNNLTVNQIQDPGFSIKRVNNNGSLVMGSELIDLTGITTLGAYSLAFAYYGAVFGGIDIDWSHITTAYSNALSRTFMEAQGINNVNLSGLVTYGISALSNAFADSSIKSLDIRGITSITSDVANICNGCLYLTSVNVSGVRDVSIGANNLFSSSALTSLSWPSLTQVTGTTFGGLVKGCEELKTLDFPVLSYVERNWGGSATRVCGGCIKLESVSFGGLTSTSFGTQYQNQFAYLFDTTTGSSAPNGCTVHFPSNFDPSDPNHTFDITTLTGYPTFGGSASYIHLAYDLPATE